MINHPDVKRKRVTCYTHTEMRTCNGQLLEVRLPSEHIDQVREALALVMSVDPAVNYTTNVTHGGYGRYSRFKIDQKKYAGGHGGYVEALHVMNAPDDRCPNILHIMSSYKGSSFAEFKSIRNAVDAWTKYLRQGETDWKDFTGFIRHVQCGTFDPWFYALGDQHLSGDFVFPDVFNEHPQYQVGKRFLVTDKFDSCRSIKMCMGAITREKETSDYWGHTKKKYLETEIFWDDGTSTCDVDCVRQLESDKLWIDDAITQFKRLISGACKTFEVPFVDGSKFIGRLKLSDATCKSMPGTYSMSIIVKDKGKERTVTGRQSFKPSEDCKTIYDRIRIDAEAKGLELVKFVSCVKEGKRGEAATWKGVYDLEKEETKQDV